MLNIPRYKLIYLLGDYAIIAIFLIVSNIALPVLNEGMAGITLYTPAIILVKFTLGGLFVTFVYRYHDLYKINVIYNQKQHIKKLLTANAFLFFLALLLYPAFFLIPEFTGDWYAINIIALAITYTVVRTQVITRLYKYLSSKYLRNNILLVGDGNAAKLLAAEFFINNPAPFKIVGTVCDELSEGSEIFSNIKVLGNTSRLKEIILSSEVDEVIFTVDKLDYPELIKRLDELKQLNVRVKISSDLLRVIHKEGHPEKYYGIPVLEIQPKESGFTILKYDWYKRVFDLIVSSLAIIALSPLFLVIAFLVKVTSRGPVIYRQERVGKDGKIFSFYKFRSMTVDEGGDVERQKEMLKFIETNGKGNSGFKVINEKRVTKVGGFLRKTSLDELPQLFNVIKGDMSLVGPRPCLPYEYSRYTEWQKRRHDVLPGCTGYWQIFGRNKVTFMDSILMDVYYIYVRSPLRDLEYIIRTLPAMIMAKGK